MEVLIRGMLNRETLLDLTRHFVVFEKSRRTDARTGQVPARHAAIGDGNRAQAGRADSGRAGQGVKSQIDPTLQLHTLVSMVATASSPLKTNPELEKLALRHVWWKTPQEALENKDEFLACLLNRGTKEDIHVAKKYFTNEDFIHVLRNPPLGIIDERSWHFWHIVLLGTPLDQIPGLPKREFMHEAAS
jgi:hypothetical protein